MLVAVDLERMWQSLLQKEIDHVLTYNTNKKSDR